MPYFIPSVLNGTNIQPNANFAIQSTSASSIGGIIRGATSQTANLQEWQKSDGTILSYIDSLGNIYRQGAIALNARPRMVLTDTANNIYYGQALQQDTGYYWFGGANTINTSGVAKNTNYYSGGIRSNIGASSSGLSYLSSRGTANDLDFYQAFSLTATSGDFSQRLASGTTTSDAILEFGHYNGNNFASRGVIRYRPSTVLFDVPGELQLRSPATGTTTLAIFSQTNGTTITPGSASVISLIVKGLASQTADLQQWQNSSGTVLAAIKSSGNMKLVTASGSNALDITSELADGAVTLTAYSGTSNVYPALIMGRKSRGTAATPSALLSGDMMSALLARGYNGSAFTTTSSVGIYLYAGSNWSTTDNATYLTFETTPSASTTRSERLRVSPGGSILINTTTSTLGSSSAVARLGVVTGATTTVGAVIRGIASQSANLQEWQDSTGTVLTSISSGGNIVLSDGKNIVAGTSSGTKIGTSTSQLFGFWNATPIVQPTTGVGSATRVGGGGTALTDTDTFDGYTLAQIVKALRNTGLLA